MKKILCLLGLLLALIQPCFSASVTIENYTPEELKNTLMKLYVKQGANIKIANDYQLVIDERGSFWTNVFFGSKFNSYVTIRTTYNFVKDGKDTVVNMNMEQITNPNSAFQTAVPISEKQLSPIVFNIQKALNGYYGYGFNYKKHRKYLEIVQITNNNLRYGDKIIEIDNIPVKKISKSNIDKLLSVNETGKELNIKILRNDNEKNIILKSDFIKPKFTKEL